MKPRGAKVRLLAGLWPLLASGPAGAAPAAPVSVSVSDHVIQITPRYQGERVRVSGTAPEGCAVVVELISSLETVRYSRKGKVGPLWLSVGQVRFENVPRMYKLKSTGPIDDILSASEQVKYGLGRRGLKASMRVSRGVDRDLYLNELILIREQHHFFSFHETAVRRQGRAFSMTFFWPPDGPPDHYRVKAYAVRDGQVVGTATTEVEVRAVGIEAWIRTLAAKHGIVYGLLAVLIALASGLSVSFACRRSPRRPPRPRAGPKRFSEVKD